MIYQQTVEQRKMTDREIAVRDMSLIKVLQQQGIKAYILEALKKESQQKTIPGLAPILVAALYETLGHRLLDADKKIAQQQKKLQPLMASRKTAEENKKAAAGKVEAEIKRLFVSEQNLKNVNNHYYPAPATKLLADYLGLQVSQAKTPAADGINQKPRWMDAKGGQLYEWNTFTGKMETYKPGHWETELTPSGKAEPVWVVESVIDPVTGLYGITLPDKDGKQGRTVLISPLKAPGADGLGHLLHPEQQQIIILNTGNNEPIITPIVRVYPNLIPPDIETPVNVPPLENGYQPLYVMFNSPLDVFPFTRKQLDKKFKHASDFGINDTQKNSETLTKYRDAIAAHLNDKDTIEKGTYPREKNSKVFFNQRTHNVVILDKDGLFVSGWKLSVGEPQFNNYIEKGVLQ
ncbi:colicin D domain-containing protein [Arsenophonus apicola]|uniref:colicin D domain-containing protein n=2 Tax=Morganellaceae TaxID=1903414 RepID=UPI00387A4731